MTFDRRRRGYDTEAVEAVMEAVATELSRALNERDNLQATLDKEGGRAQALEQRLGKTLLIAEATASDVIGKANSEARELVEEARASAAAIIEEAYREREHLAKEIEGLQTQRREMTTGYRALLLSALDLVDDVDDEPAESESGPDPVELAERTRSAHNAPS